MIKSKRKTVVFHDLPTEGDSATDKNKAQYFGGYTPRIGVKWKTFDYYTVKSLYFTNNKDAKLGKTEDV